MGSPRRDVSVAKVASLAFDVLGWLLVAASVRKLASAVYAPLHPYDDGILLTNSMLVTMGEVPYRDFYSNYGPGIFLTLAAVWKLTGVSALVARVFGILLHLAIAALAGALAGRIAGRRFSALAAGLVAAWLSILVPSPFAWLAALALALASLWFLCSALETPSRARWATAGALLGATSWYRPDLTVWLVLSLAAVAAAFASTKLSARGPRMDALRTHVVAGAGGLAAAVLPVWGVLFWLSGTLPIRDIFVEQIHVQRARLLPAPPLLEPLRLEGSPLALPAFVLAPHPGAFVLGCTAPLVALLMVAAGRRIGIASRPAAALVGALAIAVLPQALARSDLSHCLYTVTPALVLLAAAAQALTGAGTVGCLLACLLVGSVFLPARDLAPRPPAWPQVSTRDFPCYGGIGEIDPDVLEVARFLDAHTAVGEPVFVGLGNHRRTVSSHLLIYFVAGRPGGTRYLQFDPNVTNREDVQAAMVRDLELRRVNWVVLFSRWDSYREANESSRPGSELLDRYLAETYSFVTRFGFFEIRRRIAPVAVAVRADVGG